MARCFASWTYAHNESGELKVQHQSGKISQSDSENSQHLLSCNRGHHLRSAAILRLQRWNTSQMEHRLNRRRGRLHGLRHRGNHMFRPFHGVSSLSLSTLITSVSSIPRCPDVCNKADAPSSFHTLMSHSKDIYLSGIKADFHGVLALMWSSVLPP